MCLTDYCHPDDGGIPPKRRFLQEPHGVTSQKMAFLIVTAMKISNLTFHEHIFSRTFASKSFINLDKGLLQINQNF
jgi:hypothetical protein